MKIFFFLWITFVFISFDAKTQNISLSINGKQLTVFDSMTYKHPLNSKKIVKDWRDLVLDSIDTDKEKAVAVRFMKNDTSNIPILVEIRYIGRAYHSVHYLDYSDRPYGEDSLKIDKNDSLYVFPKHRYFDLLFFYLQYGKQRFHSVVKFYSGEYQKKKMKLCPYNFINFIF